MKTIHASQPDAVVMVSAYTSIAEFVRADEEGRQRRDLLQRLVRRQQGARRRARQGRRRRGDLAGGAVPLGHRVPVVKEYQQLAKKAGFTDYNFSALEGFLSPR